MQFHFRLPFLLLFLFFNASFACPFIITNDSTRTIIIVDPYNKQAVYMNPGEKREIDPSISGWAYYFYHEKLDVYEPRPDNPQLFYRHYQLVENYCTKDKTELSLSSIAGFINKPTDRFDASEFMPHEHAAHTH